ncbi:hypothetical protein [Mesorhizobium sp. BR1-1-2]|uniref:hypothetical protein n=1 Tax=Mesorhizobium sp. BR1-1-2 TaxID=2876652 RepID=UPI001CC9EBE8|nr:hypothetical protein [Mesorhizobium sp. BR1-1-2]MBZ9966283.1 hypothetical protein [Mesorhizobium sp. BR1-1-2]
MTLAPSAEHTWLNIKRTPGAEHFKRPRLAPRLRSRKNASAEAESTPPSCFFQKKRPYLKTGGRTVAIRADTAGVAAMIRTRQNGWRAQPERFDIAVNTQGETRDRVALGMC